MAPPTVPADLLERAICYGAQNIEAVTAGFLPHPTPCTGWDLHALLRHVNDSIGVLRQGIELGCVDLVPAETEDEVSDDDPAARLVAGFRSSTRRLLSAWVATGHRGRRITVGGHPLAAELMAITAAIEIAVHGWDIAVACGSHRPVPPTLAIDLLMLSPLVVRDELRHSLFAAPVAAPRSASPSDQLIAFLGRSPAA